MPQGEIDFAAIKLISIRETKDNELHLANSASSVLFDWDVTLEAALVLRNLYGDFLGLPVTQPEYEILRARLAAKFPETLRADGKADARPAHIEGEGAARCAIFEGLGFDNYRNALFQYRLRIGNGIFTEHRKFLILGPRLVDRAEFEGRDASRSPNGSRAWKPTPDVARLNRAEYDTMREFQTIVGTVLPQVTVARE